MYRIVVMTGNPHEGKFKWPCIRWIMNSDACWVCLGIVADLKSDDSLRVIASLTELNDLLNMSGEEISIGFPIETTVLAFFRWSGGGLCCP